MKRNTKITGHMADAVIIIDCTLLPKPKPIETMKRILHIVHGHINGPYCYLFGNVRTGWNKDETEIVVTYKIGIDITVTKQLSVDPLWMLRLFDALVTVCNKPTIDINHIYRDKTYHQTDLTTSDDDATYTELSIDDDDDDELTVADRFKTESMDDDKIGR